MGVAVIISEFNPFHNGHSFLISEAKELTDASKIFCVMSGSFVQRGTPAVADRFARAKTAIENGADAVFEMPSLSGSFSGNDFAYCGVRAATLLNADYLCFGSECGDIALLKRYADFLCDQPQDFEKRLNEKLKDGKSYPRALAETAGEYDERFAQISAEPNNTLAVSYLVALKKLGSKITPVTVKRIGNYDSTEADGNFLSAEGIRKKLAENCDVSQFTPEVFSSFDKNYLENYRKFLHATVATKSVEYLKSVYEVSEGLENSISSTALSVENFDDLIFGIKSKRYTFNRLQRIFTNCALGVTADFVNNVKNLNYLRLLAAKREVMPTIKKCACAYAKFSEVPEDLKEVWLCEDRAAKLRETFSPTPTEKRKNTNAVIFD